MPAKWVNPPRIDANRSTLRNYVPEISIFGRANCGYKCTFHFGCSNTLRYKCISWISWSGRWQTNADIWGELFEMRSDEASPDSRLSAAGRGFVICRRICLWVSAVKINQNSFDCRTKANAPRHTHTHTHTIPAAVPAPRRGSLEFVYRAGW